MYALFVMSAVICVLFVVSLYVYFFFFFKHKTAYEMLSSLVGSEMCLRDRHTAETGQVFEADTLATVWALTRGQPWPVSYTHLTLQPIYSV